jgi:amino acid transporter
MISWTGILWTSIRWHKGLKLQGIDRKTLPYTAPLQPYLSYCKFSYDIRHLESFSLFILLDGISITTMVMIFGGFSAFGECATTFV